MLELKDSCHKVDETLLRGNISCECTEQFDKMCTKYNNRSNQVKCEMTGFYCSVCPQFTAIDADRGKEKHAMLIAACT